MVLEADRYRVKGRMAVRSDDLRAWRYNRDGSPKYDSFMHSQQCEDYESLTPGCAVDYCSLANVPGTECSRIRRGELVFNKFRHVCIDFEHEQCGCWCHRTAIDRNAPPDFISIATDAQTFASEYVEPPVADDAPDLELAAELRRDEYAGNLPPVFNDEPDDPVCELCSEPMSRCDCVEYDEVTQTFKNGRGEVVRCADGKQQADIS